MANTTPSPNMSMPIPTVSTDPGPDWANNINASLNIVDRHNHTAGSGVQITPAGININTDFAFNNNNATALRSARLQAQGAPISASSDLGCLYQSGVDLYYNDGDGNQIRMTQSGSPSGATGTITGLPSGTASASYSAGVFSFQSATATPAEMNVGSVVVGQQVASGFGVTLKASGSQASNYNVTLPAALPGTAGYIQMDTSGNLTIQGVVVPGTSNGLVSLNGLPGHTSGSAISAGYVGEVIFGPGGSTPTDPGSVHLTSSASWENIQNVTLSAGIWQIFTVFLVISVDNSTNYTSGSTPAWNVSAGSGSATGVYGAGGGGFTGFDYNVVFATNSQDNLQAASGTGTVVVRPTTSTTYYVNANVTYTGTAPVCKASMTAVRIA
jgi:hypothetical protein